MRPEDTATLGAVAFAIPWFWFWIRGLIRARAELQELLELFSNVWQVETNKQRERRFSWSRSSSFSES